MKLMRWDNVECALDDKPHEWFSEVSEKPVRLKLSHQKKSVYLIKFKKDDLDI